MQRQDEDVRFGHDLREVQDENGVDLLLLRNQLSLPLEERFLRLERQLEFVAELRGAATRS